MSEDVENLREIYDQLLFRLRLDDDPAWKISKNIHKYELLKKLARLNNMEKSSCQYSTVCHII